MPSSPSEYSIPQITQVGRWLVGGVSAGGDDNFRLLPGVDPLQFYNSDGGDLNSTVYRQPQQRRMVGPGLSFAFDYYARTGQNVTLVPCAVGATGFDLCTTPDAGGYVTNWQPVNVSEPGSAGFLYFDCVNRTRWLLRHNDARHTRFEPKGLLWVQGENNANGNNPTALYGGMQQTQAEHSASVAQLVQQFRADLSAPALPFVVGMMSPAAFPAPPVSPIQLSIMRTPWDVERSAVAYAFDSRGQPLNVSSYGAIHFSAGAQRVIGETMARAFTAAELNSADSSTPGVIVQTFVHAASLTAHSAGIGWSPDPLASRYELLINKQLSLINLTATPASFVYGAVPYTVVQHLTSRTVYHFQVRAIGPPPDFNRGDWSLPNTFTTRKQGSSRPVATAALQRADSR